MRGVLPDTQYGVSSSPHAGNTRDGIMVCALFAFGKSWPVLVEFTGMFSCRGSYHSRCRGYFMDSGTFCDAEALSLSVAA